MELFIRIKDGQPFEHPILKENFEQAFVGVDIENLPSEFAKFERVERPVVGVYEVYDGVTYEWRSDVIADVHHVRPMTEEEITDKQDLVKSAWAANKFGYASWIFDDALCIFLPPTPYPTDGKAYAWSEDTQQWTEMGEPAT